MQIVNLSAAIIIEFFKSGGFVMSKKFNKIVSVISAFVLSFLCLVTFPVKHTADSVGGAEMPTELAAETMIERFNEERAALGYQPLKIVPYLNTIAEIRANEAVELYSHIRYDGTEVDSIIDTEIVNFSWAGEVLGRGTYNIESMLNAWKTSPEKHWDIISKETATHVGIAVVYAPDHPKKWHWAAVLVEMPFGETLPDQRLPHEKAIVPKYCGDVNGDGQIDSFDLVLLNKYINDDVFFNTAQIEAADVLDDGVITTADASALRKYILGSYHKLPVTIDMLIG